MDNKKKSYQNFFILLLLFFWNNNGANYFIYFCSTLCVDKKIISMLIKPPHSPCTFCVLLQVTVYLIQWSIYIFLL